MPIYAPSTSNIATLLASQNIKEVWIGGELYFGVEEVPPGASLTFVETQASLNGVTTNQVPIVGTNLQVGDTVCVITRSDGFTPTIATLSAGNTVSRRVTRTTGFSDTLVLWTFEVVVAQAGVASFDMTLNISNTLTHADVLVVRGKSLPNVYNPLSVLNTASLDIPITGVPTTNGDSLLFAGFNCSTTNAISITSTSCTIPISGNMGTPKVGITGFVCIVKQEDLVQATLASTPVASGQTIAGCWLN